MSKQPTWLVERFTDGSYRAELWVLPYSGRMLAATRAVMSRAQAARDGARVFPSFARHESQTRSKKWG